MALVEWPYRLLLTFWPQIVEGCMDLWMVLCLWMQVQWRGHTEEVRTLKPYLLLSNSFDLFALRSSGDANIFLAPTHALIPIHAWSCPMQEPPCETITTCYFIKWLSGSVTAKTNRGHRVNGYSFDNFLDGQIFGRWELAVWHQIDFGFFSWSKVVPKAREICWVECPDLNSYAELTDINLKLLLVHWSF